MCAVQKYLGLLFSKLNFNYYADNKITKCYKIIGKFITKL